MAERNNSIIRNPVHINAILARLEKNHCQLEVRKTDKNPLSPSLGMTAILNVDYSNDNILFDTLNHNHITKNQHLEFFTKHEGIEMYFQSRVTRLAERNHLIYFNTQIPTEVIYKQRRLQYRVELQNLWKIPVTLIDKKSNTPLTAYIYNISTGGINVRSTTDNLTRIKSNSIIHTLIQLPNNKHIECKLQVRQTQLDTSTGLQQLAGQFIKLSSQHEKNIRSFVNSVERSKIKTTAAQHTEYS